MLQIKPISTLPQTASSAAFPISVDGNKLFFQFLDSTYFSQTPRNSGGSIFKLFPESNYFPPPLMVQPGVRHHLSSGSVVVCWQICLCALQFIYNTTVRIFKKKKKKQQTSDHVTPLLKTLQWLPPLVRIKGKGHTVVYRAFLICPVSCLTSSPPFLTAYTMASQFLENTQALSPQGVCTSCSLGMECSHPQMLAWLTPPPLSLWLNVIFSLRPMWITLLISPGCLTPSHS